MYATSLVTILDSRLMPQPAFLPAAVTEQVGSQPAGDWISGILGQTVRWDRYRSAWALMSHACTVSTSRESISSLAAEGKSIQGFFARQAAGFTFPSA